MSAWLPAIVIEHDAAPQAEGRRDKMLRPACFLPKSTFENVPGLKVNAGVVPRGFQAGAKTRSLPRDTNAAQDVPGKT